MPLIDVTDNELRELTRHARSGGWWDVKAWPSCGEASVTYHQPARKALQPGDPGYHYWLEWTKNHPRDTEADNEERALRRAKSAVRRYSRHNSLTQMVTFTFAGEPPEYDSLSATVQHFWRRWSRATGRHPGPYVWVPEWGKVSHRLHIHMAVSWWDDLNCTEVCPRCDKFGVLQRHPRATGGCLCIGCLWGQGFVGRPLSRDAITDNGDGRALSRYLSKYMAKDLGSDLDKGAQRYRAAKGYDPQPLDLTADSLHEGITAAGQLLGDTFGDTAPRRLTPKGDTYKGPPCVLLDWIQPTNREAPQCNTENS